MLQTTVKKWFRDKNYGFLDNGEGSDIMVRKADLLNCQYLRVGVTVDLEVVSEKSGLVAKKVKLAGARDNQNARNSGQNNRNNQKSANNQGGGNFNGGNNNYNGGGGGGGYNGSGGYNGGGGGRNNSNGQRNNNGNRPFRPGVMT